MQIGEGGRGRTHALLLFFALFQQRVLTKCRRIKEYRTLSQNRGVGLAFPEATDCTG